MILAVDYARLCCMDGTRKKFLTRHLSDGLSFEKRVATELRHGKVNDDWIEREPELQDWLEANAISL